MLNMEQMCSIAGVFPTEQEAYEYFDLDETEDNYETV